MDLGSKFGCQNTNTQNPNSKNAPLQPSNTLCTVNPKHKSQWHYSHWRFVRGIQIGYPRNVINFLCCLWVLSIIIAVELVKFCRTSLGFKVHNQDLIRAMGFRVWLAFSGRRFPQSYQQVHSTFGIGISQTTAFRSIYKNMRIIVHILVNGISIFMFKMKIGALTGQQVFWSGSLEIIYGMAFLKSNPGQPVQALWLLFTLVSPKILHILTSSLNRVQIIYIYMYCSGSSTSFLRIYVGHMPKVKKATHHLVDLFWLPDANHVWMYTSSNLIIDAI